MKFQLVKSKSRTLDVVREQFSGKQDARWRGLGVPKKREFQIYNILDVHEAQLAMRNKKGSSK